MKRHHILALCVTAIAVAVPCMFTRASVEAQAGAPAAPAYVVDATWPKELPNKWIVGQVTGVAIDSRDHVFIVHRPGSLDANETAASTNPPGAECCIAAPPVLEFDAAGNVVNGWGGPGVGFEWPDSEHGLYVDYRDHVWLTGNPHLALKFSHDGKFLLQIGTKGKTNGSNDPKLLGNATDLAVDPKTNEVFVSDGYANNRVVVFDADTGAYKRHWGAYGDTTPPDGRTKYDPKGPPARQFVVPHGIAMSNDGIVYVSDRLNDRIQAFTREGKFVKEGVVAPQTLINGSAWGVEVSRDSQQRYLFVADGTNGKVWILNRDTLQMIGSFGRQGRHAGQFYWLHALAVDSKGNIYTAEVGHGRRVQKFVPRAMPTTAE